MIFKNNLSNNNNNNNNNNINNNNNKFLDILNKLTINQLIKFDNKQKQLIFFNFLNFDIIKTFNYNTNKKEIVDVYKYGEIFNKLKLFSQLILLNINNNNINTIVNNNLLLREQIFNFSNYFYKKTNYYKVFLIVYKQEFIKSINILTITGHLIKLIKFINFILNKQLFKNLTKIDLNNLISKVIFYNSIIIFYLKNKHNLINK